MFLSLVVGQARARSAVVRSRTAVTPGDHGVETNGGMSNTACFIDDSVADPCQASSVLTGTYSGPATGEITDMIRIAIKDFELNNFHLTSCNRVANDYIDNKQARALWALVRGEPHATPAFALFPPALRATCAQPAASPACIPPRALHHVSLMLHCDAMRLMFTW